MAEFINTVDVLGDDAVIDSIIDRTITEFKDDTITKVSSYAFYKCSSLSAVELPNVTSVGDRAFMNCTNLVTLDVRNITQLPARMCESCESLISADFPMAKTSNNNYGGPFAKCKSLVNINMPLMTNVGWTMFEGCTSLERAKFPSVTDLGLTAFGNCTSLVMLDFPVLKSMNTNFASPKTIKALVIRNTEKVVTASAAFAWSDPFGSKTCFAYVPRVMYDSYLTATNWSAVPDQIRVLEDYTVDGTTTGELDETKI